MTKVLVTYGGTIEPIDDVRSIRNESSGRLGSIIAECFAANQYEVTTIHSKTALPTQNKNIHSIVANSVVEVDQAIRNVMETFKPKIVIHAMAISDFMVTGVYDYATIKHSNQESDLLKHSKREGKIHADGMKYIGLHPAPKLIQNYKQLNSDIFLVGFKLLAQTDDAHLLKAAYQQMQAAHSDLVVCNHQEKVGVSDHEAMLVNRNHNIIHCYTKEDIAQQLVAYVQKESL